MPTTSQAILADLAALGVTVAVADGQIKFDKKSAIPPELLARMRANKADLIAAIESHTPTQATSKTSKTALPEVSEVREQGELRGNFDSGTTTLESWCPTPPKSVPIADPLGLTRVSVIPPSDPQKHPSVLAEVVLVFADLIAVDGVHVMREANHRITIRYPKVVVLGGKKVDAIRAISTVALRVLEDRILAEVRAKGYLLASFEPDVPSTLECAPDGEVA